MSKLQLYLAAIGLIGLLALAIPSASRAEPWTLEDPNYDRSDGLRVLVYHDMEGLAGQDNLMSYVFGMPEYPQGQEMLAADINAVIAGLYQGGATEVDVVDAHGSLNPDPDVRRDLLDSRAGQVSRDQPFDGYIDLIEVGYYDAVVAVGNHAKTGSGGFAAHTKTLGIEVFYGDRTVTESEMIALAWGDVGVPMILVTGDDRLRDDLSTMPWLEYVTTKKATGVDSAELRPVPEVHAEKTAKARRALENLDQARAMKIKTPVEVRVRAISPSSLEAANGLPGLDCAGNVCRFEAENYEAAYRGADALINVAQGGWLWSAMGRLVRDGNMTAYSETFGAVAAEWIDAESGRLQRSPPQEERKYYGSQ